MQSGESQEDCPELVSAPAENPPLSYADLLAFASGETEEQNEPILTTEQRETVRNLITRYQSWFDAYVRIVFEINVIRRIDAAPEDSDQQTALVELLGEGMLNSDSFGPCSS